MALKLKINEKCDRCGKRAASVRGIHVWESHQCDDPVPGPPSPPRKFLLAEVIFVRGDFSKEELAVDLEAAFAEIHELRTRLMKQKTRLDNVFVAMKNYETNRVG